MIKENKMAPTAITEFPKNIESIRPGFHTKAVNIWQILALPFVLFIFIPIFAIIVKTPINSFLIDINQAQMVQAISISLLTTFITTVVTLVFGTPVAILLTNHKNRLITLIDTLVDLPTVLPPSVAGIALLMAFGRKGILGPFLSDLGITIPFTMIAVVIAQTFVAAPFYIKAAAIGFGSVDDELKQAAALDGANRWQILRYVIMPIAWSSILSGAAMTWARALGEFGATIIFAGNFPGRTQTMPLAIYMGFEINLNVALTLSVILIVLSFLTLILTKGILQRRLEFAPQRSSGQSF